MKLLTKKKEGAVMVETKPLLDSRRVHLERQLNEAIARAEDACVYADLLQQKNLQLRRTLNLQLPLVYVSVQNQRVTVQVR